MEARIKPTALHQAHQMAGAALRGHIYVREILGSYLYQVSS
jgi:hypothetical protein